MDLNKKSEQLKYIKSNLETTFRLSKVLQNLYEDNYLTQCLVLKGGTAVQLYLDKFKRLFFDLDIDVLLKLSEKNIFRDYLLEYMKKPGYDQMSNKRGFSYSLDSYK